MNKVVTISGWGQAHDALKNVVPENSLHLDYSQFASTTEFFKSITDHHADLIVGWSQGGQLALRAISENILSCKSLVLLATPYQFVANKDIKCGMDRVSFNTFISNFESDPVKTLKRFLTLISKNDSNAHDVLTVLRHNTNFEHISRWLPWLEELENFSCNFIDFSGIPKTYAIHSRDDTIVDITHTGLFKSLIKNYTLEVFDHCGHAPHLHNEARVREIIQAAL